MHPGTLLLEFGPFTLDSARCELRKHGRAVPVQPKVLDLLRYLIEHRDRLVPYEELNRELWSGAAVSPASMRRTATLLRSALDDDARKPRWIATAQRRGYRFIGELAKPRLAPEVRAPLGDYRRLLVGRVAERGLLSDAFRIASGGTSALVLVEGEAGIGKSRLLEWCAQEAQQHGLRAVVSHCREDEGAPPLWPWMQAVQHASALIAPERSRRVLARVAPALAPLFPDLKAFLRKRAPAHATDPRALRFQAYQALEELLREVSLETPLALLFDDLHRADASSLALLEFLVSRLSDCKIAFVGSMRPEGAERAELARMGRNPRCRALSVPTLSVDDVRELIVAAAPNSASIALAQPIWQQTGGNAFFVHQILPLAAQLAENPERSIVQLLPRTVRKAIEEQCATLSPEARLAVRSASVFGREFSSVLLAQALDRSESAILSAVDEALQLHLLAGIPDVPHHYRYAHLLVRDVLYDGISSHERALLHGRVGAVLEAACSDPADLAGELAYHFSAAGTQSGLEKAIAYHALAGEVATARFDYAASLEHYRSALRLLESMPDPDPGIACDLRIRLGLQSLGVGLIEVAQNAWLQAAEQARAIADPARLVRVALALSSVYRSHGYLVDPHETRRLLTEAIHCSDGCGTAERSVLLARLAYLLHLASAPEAAEEASARALQLAKDCRDSLAMAEVLSTEHLRRRGTPAVRERCDIAGELIRHADRGGDQALQLSYLVYRAADFAELGDFGGWELTTDAHAWLAERLKTPESIAVSYRNRAMRARMLGKFAEARSLTERALALAQHCDPAILFEAFNALLALEAETSGPTQQTLDHLSRMKPTPTRFVGELWVYQQLERPDPIRDRLGQVMTQIREHAPYENRPYQIALIAEAAAYVHDTEHAEQALELLDGFEDLHVLTGIGGVYVGPALRYIALLQATLGRSRESVESLEESLRRARGISAVAWEARIELDLATVRAERRDIDDRARAVQHARKAVEIAERIGMRHLEQRARRLAGV